MRRLSIVFALLLVLAVPAFAADNRVLYQRSTIDALMAGQYDGNCTLAELSKHGDFGIGTFDKLDGEMVLLDGRFYRVSSDGKARPAATSETSPFASVTFFSPTRTATLGAECDLEGMVQRIDSLLPSKNLFCAIRIEGRFAYVKTRSVPKQDKPYPRLTDVVAHQPTFEMRDVKGTIVGLYCPYFVKGVNVPGYHFHFITSDRLQGGHLLDCRFDEAAVALDSVPVFTLILPTTSEFSNADLQSGAPGDLKKVEQGR